MKTLRNFLALTFLLFASSSQCIAMMEIENVSKARANELGMVVRSNAAGPDAVRVELEFEIKGELKSFSRVDLEFSEGGKFLVTSSLREDRSKPGRLVVSFAAGRARLEMISLIVVVQRAPRDMTGYAIRVKDFVELEKLR